jgi:type II secretory pathway pseudopilin PulG
MMTRKLYPLALFTAAPLVAAGCSNNDRDDPPPPPPVNVAPVVSAIADQSANQDTVVGPVSFTVTDTDSAADALTIAVSANSTTVIPADGIVLAGTGGTRTLTFTPFEAATGVTTISVSARDPQGLSTTNTFRVTFNARTASFRDSTLATFAKADGDAPTPVRGFTFTQDADDPATFAGLIPVEP